jgi:hypothetical protein
MGIGPNPKSPYKICEIALRLYINHITDIEIIKLYEIFIILCVIFITDSKIIIKIIIIRIAST